MKSKTIKRKKVLTDIKYLDIPNVCFSLTSKKDKREKVFSEQRMERGFDDSETWSLRDTIGKFTLPRLKRFKEIYTEKIVNEDDTYKKLDLAIRAFELLIRDNGTFTLTQEEHKEYDDGMKAYHEIFLGLWW